MASVFCCSRDASDVRSENTPDGIDAMRLNFIFFMSVGPGRSVVGWQGFQLFETSECTRRDGFDGI